MILKKKLRLQIIDILIQNDRQQFSDIFYVYLDIIFWNTSISIQEAKQMILLNKMFFVLICLKMQEYSTISSKPKTFCML